MSTMEYENDQRGYDGEWPTHLHYSQHLHLSRNQY